MHSAIRLRVLGSGSSGNASLVAAGDTTALVEAGLSARELGKRAQAAGCDPERIAGILVSHEHADHSRGALPFARRHDIPIFCTAGTWRRIRPDDPDGVLWVRLVPSRPLRIGELEVIGFPTPHDAEESVGFRFQHAGASAVLVTDIGHISTETERAIEGASLLLIESNYDEQELHESRYPFSTRRRIASQVGHLSNGALAAYLRRRLPHSVRTVVLAHLSENTNSPELAFRTARQALDAGGRAGVRLLIARRNEPTPEVRSSAPEARRLLAFA